MARSFQATLQRSDSDLAYQAEQEELARKQRLAELLRQQSAQPEGQMVSGRFVAPAITQRLASVFNAYQSGALSRQADQQAREAAQARADRTSNEMAQIVAALTGGQRGVEGMPDESGNPTVQMEPVAPDSARAMRLAAGAQSPEGRAFVPQILGFQQQQQAAAEQRAFLERQAQAQREWQEAQGNRPRPVTVTETLPDGSTRQVIREVAPGQADGLVVGTAPRPQGKIIPTNQGMVERMPDGSLRPLIGPNGRPVMPYQAPSQGGVPVQPITVMENGRAVIKDARTGRVLGEAPPQGGSGGRLLAPTAVTNLSEIGTTAQNTLRIAETFRDNFGGYRAGPIGRAANVVGSNFGMGFQEQADWWRDYQMEKNIVRNRLFGSALTAAEAAEWERAAINPGMTPQAIKTNLERQRVAALSAAAKLAGAYVAQGYSQEAIEQAVGIPLGELQEGARQFARLGRVNQDPRLDNPVPPGVLPPVGSLGNQPAAGAGPRPGQTVQSMPPVGRIGQQQGAPAVLPQQQGQFRILGVERP